MSKVEELKVLKKNTIILEAWTILWAVEVFRVEEKLGRKVENSEIFRFFKDIENFDHNSAENNDFDDGQI